MSKFTVFSDSACDFTANMTQRSNLNVVPIKASFDGVSKLTEGVDITSDIFYNYINTHRIIPKTYFPTVKEYVTAFKKSLEQGRDVLCICLSSNLSKSYYSALRAKEILAYNYKNNKIMIIDSLLASGAQGLLVLNAVKLRDESVGVDIAYEKLMKLKSTAVTIFTLKSLEQLARGGRMSQATAMIATMLNINPIIHLEKGLLISKEKAVGRSKAIESLGKIAIGKINGKTDDYDLCVFHSRSLKEAKELETTLKTNFKAKPACEPLEVGVSIGSHTGSSVVALSFMKRVEKL